MPQGGVKVALYDNFFTHVHKNPIYILLFYYFSKKLNE
jgi:hypothetical protein